MVTDVDERGIDVQDKDGRTERIEAVTKIWAAGVQAVPLRQDARPSRPARPLDRAGRIGVNPDLTLPGLPRGVRGRRHDRPRPPARASRRSRSRARSTPPRRSSAGSAGKPPQKPFHYFDKGDLATISRFRAVALIGKLRLTGFVAWLLWLGVHLVYLTGFKNRVTRAAALGGVASSAAAARSAPPPSSRSSAARR